MTSFEELNELSSEELHDRAVSHAKRHLNVKFFWNLLQMTPAANAESGDVGQADSDVLRVSGQLADAVEDRPELREAMRPLYIDYLLNHPKA
jgi:hypothetical protein